METTEREPVDDPTTDPPEKTEPSTPDTSPEPGDPGTPDGPPAPPDPGTPATPSPVPEKDREDDPDEQE